MTSDEKKAWLLQYKQIKAEIEELPPDKVPRGLVARIEAIETAISALPLPTPRRLLRLRYIEGLTWQRVAERLNYSREHIWRLHREALEQLDIVAYYSCVSA